MGLLDKVFGSTAKKPDPTVQGSFIQLCIAAAGADGSVSSQEGRSIMTYINRLKMFEEVNETAMQKMFDKAFADLESKGSKAMIQNNAPVINAEIRPTVFACIADIVLSDGELEDEEKEVLEQVHKALSIEESVAVSIIEVMLIKNRM